MTITETQKNITLFPNKIDNLEKSNRNDFILKGLLSLALLVAGVFAATLMHTSFLPIAIALILVGGVALRHYYHQYKNTKELLERANIEIANNLPQNRLG